MEITTKCAERFLKGDTAAVEEVHLAYRRLLYFIIVSIVKNNEDAEDVFQDLFTTLVAKRPDVKAVKFQSYLCQSAKNAAINFAKKRDSLVDYSDGIDVLYGENDHSNPYLQGLLSGLSDKENIIVVYKIVYDFSFREIASLTGISRQSADTIYREALKKMKKLYGGNPYDQQK